MKLIIPLLLFLSSAACAQSPDFIILKKNDRPIRYYYSGTHIAFVAVNGARRDALITAIKNDSIYLQEFYIVRIPTTYGGFIVDTAGSFRYIYHYNQIKYFDPPARNGFNVAGSGAALLGGGILLTLASGVSYLADKDKFSPELLFASVGLGTAGYFMSKSGTKGMVVGKKYKLQYMTMTR